MSLKRCGNFDVCPSSDVGISTCGKRVRSHPVGGHGLAGCLHLGTSCLAIVVLVSPYHSFAHLLQKVGVRTMHRRQKPSQGHVGKLGRGERGLMQVCKRASVMNEVCEGMRAFKRASVMNEVCEGVRACNITGSHLNGPHEQGVSDVHHSRLS